MSPPAILGRRLRNLTPAMALAFLAVPSPARADNPIVQTYYTADPAPMVHEGRLYLYTSHDEDVTVNNFYTMNDWRLYSTTDMVNWTDHGSVASYRTFSWGTGDAWAPQGIARNGKYYLYVPLNNNTGAKIGVGVADSPAGPFMDPIGRAFPSNGSGNIDPTVFIDDDGQAYLYWGNMTLRYAKLNSDMTSFDGGITDVPLSGFTEGPWLYKRQSLYYLVYAAISGTEKISYATSNGPTGPWTVRGDIMAAGPTYTNHAGIVDYKGRSYFFYHNNKLPGGGDFKRSVCVEEFTYEADGKIPTIRMTDAGPEPVDTLNPFQQVEAETIAFSSGLKTETCTDTGGGLNVSSVSNGDYIKVKNVDFRDGVTSFEARVSASSQNASIELRLDSREGTLLGTCDVSGASSWTTKTCEVSGGSGKHDLFLRFSGGNGDLFKFNWWKFDGPNEGGGTGGAGGMGGAGGTAGLGGGGSGGANGGVGGQGPSGGAAIGGSATGGSATGGASGQIGAGGSGALAGSGTGGARPVGGASSATGGAGPSTSGGEGAKAGAGPTGGGPGPAAGTPGAGDTPRSAGSSGCALGPQRDDASRVAAWSLLALALIRRRARQRSATARREE